MKINENEPCIKFKNRMVIPQHQFWIKINTHAVIVINEPYYYKKRDIPTNGNKEQKI